MAIEVKGEAMGMFTDTLKYINFDELTDTERDQLKKILQEQKQFLRAAIKTVDQDLKVLAKKPKRKRAAKRRTGRRPT
jgi:hypothetical protein